MLIPVSFAFIEVKTIPKVACFYCIFKKIMMWQWVTLAV